MQCRPFHLVRAVFYFKKAALASALYFYYERMWLLASVVNLSADLIFVLLITFFTLPFRRKTFWNELYSFVRELSLVHAGRICYDLGVYHFPVP